MLEFAIGDAFGACFEYAPPEFVKEHNTLKGYVQNPSHVDLKPGHYTDDTQMSIAVAEALVSGEPWTRELLAEKFVEVYKRDPRPGYASRFQKFLDSVRNGTEFLAGINPNSDKSGGAMRAGPLGFLRDPHEVVEKARLQASLTHNTPEGLDAAAAAALLAHFCIHEPDATGGAGNYIVDNIGHYVIGHCDIPWNEPWEGPVGAKGWMSVRAAITAVSRNFSLADLLRDCVAFTGDVDTVAAIALGAASEHLDYDLDLPDELEFGLELGRPYGVAFLRDLDEKLKKGRL